MQQIWCLEKNTEKKDLGEHLSKYPKDTKVDAMQLYFALSAKGPSVKTTCVLVLS